MEHKTIGEIVRKQKSDFTSGTTQLSKYVSHSLNDTLEQIDAYHASKHITGETDSLGREKPFFNISVANTNVWYRATDIDRSWIKLRATKSKDWIDSFLATVHLQDWMRKARFGTFLNEWGRVLAKYGSAVVKFVENDGELNISVVPWQTLIVDAVDFDANPVIEVIELTEAQLYERVQTHGYDKAKVKELSDALKARETKDGKVKDNKNNYIKLYEIHGNLPLSHITGKDEDEDTFAQQMHVISFVGKKKGGDTEYTDFTLFKGRESKSPYMITHLIKEDGRTLAIGSVESLFEAQWMVNHTNKAIKDQLDLASKTIFQTADQAFVGRNVLSNIETGDILIHSLNQPLTQLNNQALNLVAQENYLARWKQQGNEINGVSEAMLGATPKSGTAWRQTQAILAESNNLFELMTENKGLHIEDMMREWILPYLKKKMDTSEEVSATLEQYDIDRIDSIYIKNKAIELTNKAVKDKILAGGTFQEGEVQALQDKIQGELKDKLSQLGNTRFFKPDELSDKTWKEQFKDLEWEIEIDITNEAKNVQEAMTTLSTALQVAINPAFATNKKAQAIVGRILELSGTMSPLEYNAVQEEQTPAQPQAIPNIPTNVGQTPNQSAGVLPVK